MLVLVRVRWRINKLHYDYGTTWGAYHDTILGGFQKKAFWKPLVFTRVFSFSFSSTFFVQNVSHRIGKPDYERPLEGFQSLSSTSPSPDTT